MFLSYLSSSGSRGALHSLVSTRGLKFAAQCGADCTLCVGISTMDPRWCYNATTQFCCPGHAYTVCEKGTRCCEEKCCRSDETCCTMEAGLGACCAQGTTCCPGSGATGGPECCAEGQVCDPQGKGCVPVPGTPGCRGLQKSPDACAAAAGCAVCQAADPRCLWRCYNTTDEQCCVEQFNPRGQPSVCPKAAACCGYECISDPAKQQCCSGGQQPAPMQPVGVCDTDLYACCLQPFPDHVCCLKS